MQRSLTKAVAHAAIFAAAILGTTVGSQADGFLETDLVANNRPLTDRNGVVHTATFLDPHLVNPWGLTSSPTSPFWVSDNGAGVSTLYNTAGTPQSLVVSIPTPNDPLGSDGAPTGVAFNVAPGAFQISGINLAGNPTRAPAVFLFTTEDGTILGWNPAVFPREDLNRVSPNTHAIIAVDHSMAGAVYKVSPSPSTAPERPGFMSPTSTQARSRYSTRAFRRQPLSVHSRIRTCLRTMRRSTSPSSARSWS